jgi:hypothetical protein
MYSFCIAGGAHAAGAAVYETRARGLLWLNSHKNHNKESSKNLPTLLCAICAAACKELLW